MSRIGKMPILIPEGVKIETSGRDVKVVGPKGELSLKLKPGIGLAQKENRLKIEAKDGSSETAKLYGLSRTLIANMVKGVTEEFEKKLEFHGVGYRASMEGETLLMHLGFSHPIEYTPRNGVSIKTEKNTITVSGVDKQLVGQTAAEIRDFKKPEPYKGKGIRYVDEKVRRKAGKVAAKTA